MERRDFIKISSLVTLGAPMIGMGKTPKANKLTILHTNDVHSHVNPFDNNHYKYPGLGGIEQRAAQVQAIRNTEPNVILLDSGDIFQGTPFFNYFGGEMEFKLMSALQYDAATMGNHDFDNGLEGFHKQLPHASFPFLCSNYDFRNTLLEGKTIPYTIITKGRFKIGVFGIGIELDGLVNKDLYQETIYNNPYEVAKDVSRNLKVNKKCDLVICLSHLGFKYDDLNKPSDVQLAAKSEYIDIILGGHTHTLLTEPVEIENLTGKKVIINQVGWAGVYLGRIDVFFDEREKRSMAYHGQSLIVGRMS